MLTPEMLDQMVANGQITSEQAQQIMAQQGGQQPGMMGSLLNYGKKGINAVFGGQNQQGGAQTSIQPMSSSQGNVPSGTQKAQGGAQAVGSALMMSGNPYLMAAGAAITIGSKFIGNKGGPTTLEKKNQMLQYKQNKLAYQDNRRKFAKEKAKDYSDALDGLMSMLA